MARQGKIAENFKGTPKYPNLERAYDDSRKIARTIAAKNGLDLSENLAAEDEVKNLYEAHRRNRHRVSSHQLAIYIMHKYFGLSQEKIASHYSANRTSVKALVLKSVKLLGGSEVTTRPLERRISRQNFYAKLEDALAKAKDIHTEISKEQPGVARKSYAVPKEAQVLHDLHVADPKKITAKRLMIYLLSHVYQLPRATIASHYGVATSGVNHAYQETIKHLNTHLSENPSALEGAKTLEAQNAQSRARPVTGFDAADKQKLAKTKTTYPDSEKLLAAITEIKSTISKQDKRDEISKLNALHELHIKSPKKIRGIHLELYGAHFVHDISPYALSVHYGMNEKTVRALIKEASDALN